MRKTSSKTGYSLVAIVLILTLCFSYIWGYSFIDTSKNSPVDSSTLNTNIAGNTVLTRTKTAEVSITVIPTEAGTKTMATTTHVSVPTTPIAHTSLYTSSLHISITQSAGQVGQGNYATEGITTTVGAYCTIQVEYKTGPSQAQGLTPQTTNKIGSVIWTWKIGTRTTPGSWPININCSLNGSYDEISDNIIVNSQ